MSLADQLYGFGPTSASRQAVTAALLDAVHAIAALDQQLYHHPLAPAWARAEREIAVAAAAATAGPGSADIELILRARLGLIALSRGHVAISDLDARAREWAAVRQRKGSADRRALVATLAAARGTRDLVHLADAVATVLATVATASWQLTPAGQGTRTLTVTTGSAVDSGDVALAVPYALRRLGLTRSLLPTLNGNVRTLSVPLRVGDREEARSEDDNPLASLTRWAATLAAQARAGSARLGRLERYVADVERQLIMVRRPQALRRLAGVGLSVWGLWAAQLARLTGVDVSSAWRTLGQAAELGIVEPVPGDAAGARSRGDATVYAIPPWLHLAGLMPVRRGRPAAASLGAARQASLTATAAAMDEAAAAIAELDALLARAAVGTAPVSQKLP
jgi:hypothetical protein